MTNVKIDRDMLVDELYNLRKYIPVDNDDALRYIARIVDLVLKAPAIESKSQYPRISVRNS